MRALLFVGAWLALFVTGCDHDCACTATGTWAGKTTVNTSGRSFTSSNCHSDSDVTNKDARKIVCSSLCIDRAKQAGASDYESIEEPQISNCEKDCQANAKISDACVEGKRVSTFGAWN